MKNIKIALWGHSGAANHPLGRSNVAVSRNAELPDDP